MLHTSKTCISLTWPSSALTRKGGVGLSWSRKFWLSLSFWVADDRNHEWAMVLASALPEKGRRVFVARHHF